MRRHLRNAVAIVAALAAATGLAAGAIGGAGVAAAVTRITPGARPLEVLPFPGTPDVAPGAEIIFPALRPPQITAVDVEGSRSGRHLGRLSAQPGGNGTAFSPARPFVPGERVDVTAMLRSDAAAAATGAQGARRISFSFGIAPPVSGSGSRADIPPDIASPRARARSRHLTHTFHSAPSLHPPTIEMSGRVKDPAAGNIFLDAQNTGHPGAYFLNPQGKLLWFHPSATGRHPGPSVFNVRVQRYRHRPVITYWQGLIVPPGIGRGKDLILNEQYRTIHTVTAGDGYQRVGTDLHEFTLGHEGAEPTAFVTVVARARANLTSVGGPPNGTVLDWIIQEIDVPTNKVIWEWHALGHVPVSASYEPYVPGQPYDFFHLNSIQQLPDGHIIISARHTWAVYEIDKRTGRFIWELGGKHSSFRMGPGTGFRWQHDATLHNDGLVTLFDDDGSDAFGQSRGLVLHTDLASHEATLVHYYTHKPNPVLALSQGSVQLLSNHHFFVGWGSGRYFSEFTRGGAQLFDGSFAGGVQSYRAYRFSDWVGKPLQHPAIAIRKTGRPARDNLYVSWNGATRVRKWRVLASTSRSGPFHKARRSVEWSGFETKVSIPLSAGTYFEVQALNAHGGVLPRGTSPARRAPRT